MDEIIDITKRWRNWHYNNTALLVLSLAGFLILAETPEVKGVITYLGDLGLIGAFIAGIMFVSIFTVAPASVILFYLAENLNPVAVAIAAGLGGAAGDFLIYKYLKDRVFEELRPVFMEHGGRSLNKLFRTPYFAWIIPIIGVTIVASPLPDEVGIGMLGLSKIKTWQFLALTFVLNTVGIFLIVIAARSF